MLGGSFLWKPLFVALLLGTTLGCDDLRPLRVESLYPLPRPGRSPGARFILTPAGEVGVADGALLIQREDLRVHTRLGPIRVGQTWSSATGQWHDWLGLLYQGGVLIDEHGTPLSGRRFEATRWNRLDDDVLRTRGGRIYRFLDGRLTRIEASVPGGPALDFERDMGDRLLRIVQRAEVPLEPEIVLEGSHGEGGVLLQSYGRTVRRLHDEGGRLWAVEDPAAFEERRPPTRYGYNARGQLTRIEDPMGVVTQVTYERSGRVSLVRRSSEVHRFTYGVRSTPHRKARYALVYTDPTGARSEYRHDGEGRVSWVRDPEGGVWRASYQGDLPSWIENPLGERWSFEYRAGDLVSRTNPEGQRETWEREPGAWSRNEPNETPWRRWVDARGSGWTRNFDLLGREVSLTDPAGLRTHFEYRGIELRKIRRPNGSETCVYHSFPHGLLSEVDPGCSGNIYPVFRTEAGLPFLDDSGRTFIFDASGRIREILYPDHTPRRPSLLRLERNSAGQTIAAINPKGARIELDRDFAGRVIAVREQIVARGDPGWSQTGDVFVEERLERDLAGRLVARLRPNGERIELGRDLRGAIVTLRYVDKGGVPLATVRLERDRAGRVVRVDDSREAGTTEIERDRLGRPKRVDYPHGEWIEQELDALGDPTRVALYGPQGSPLGSFEWVRDTSGRPIHFLAGGELAASLSYGVDREEIEFGNGLTEERRLDSMGRLQRLALVDAQGRTLRDFELSYWLAGLKPTSRLMSAQDRSGAGEGFGVSYDEAGRLSRWSEEGHEQMRWDVLGNLRRYEHLEWGKDPESWGVTYNRAGNRMRSVSGDAVEQDPLGRVTRIGATEIEWEPFDRPRRIGSIELRYSTLGRPISRTVAGETTTFLFGGLVQADASLRPRSIEIGDLWIDLVSGAREYLHRDVRNNVAWVSDDAGTLVAVRRPGPFGTRSRDGTSRSARGFAGGEEIGEFVLLGARVYFPRAARFLSPDPLGDWTNRFTYAGGDPVNFWDPGGLRRTKIRRGIRARLVMKPFTGAEIQFSEEIVIDEPDPPLAGDEGGERGGPQSLDPSRPVPFPEFPNSPEIPDLETPVLGGCAAVARSPSPVGTWLVLLPALLLLRRG